MKKLLVLLCLLFIFPTALSYGSEHAVTLQLPWHHQFQFAGYSTAREQGFYKDAGFNVTLLEGRYGSTPVDAVVNGEYQAPLPLTVFSTTRIYLGITP
ncbi:MAG: ABC transporter substrate-binding protein [Desulfocapsa sp.]|nr:ABC transporter substrate-binding protein [Desulfocapsa sp.]